MRHWISFYLLFSSISIVYSQANYELSNIHKKTIWLKDSVMLDNQPIMPYSVSIYRNGSIIEPSLFQINYVTSIVRTDKVFNDSLIVYYRTLPLKKSSLSSNLFAKKKSSNSTNISFEPYNASNIGESNSSELEYSGSFVRGITVGNRQDASINSGFNLNMSGKLSNGLEINASMTDANIPIQPEGNSASIQEFDKIYIQLKKDSHIITLGDFDIRELPQSHFMKFDRKLQGIRYLTAFPVFNKAKLNLGATAAVTRGTFARNIFQAQENNQGPYKLVGNNGEAFIIIIAGTEKVYINGQLMKRGLDNDYTINYNVGEVIFTPNRLITQDLRIVIEFQYSDRNYFRYSLEANASVAHERYNLFSQIFTENDNRNQPINLELNRNQILRLSEIGNQIDSAIVSSSSEVQWDASRILYVKKDTIVNAQLYPIYQWVQSKMSPVYQVLFTQVGINKGNYRLKSTGANGSVYEWVAPNQGVPQGSYEPLIKLSTPKTHLQWTTGGQYRWNKKQVSSLEISYTDHDLNTFSDKQQDENKGLGLLFKHNISAPIDSTKTLNIDVEQEYTSKYFSPLTRYRNNEFQRDWSLNIPIKNTVEQSLSTLNIGYKSKYFQAKIGATYYYIPNNFNAIQSFADASWRKNQIEFRTSHKLLKGTKNDSTTIFYRPKASILYQVIPQKTSLEFGFFHEINRIQNSNIALAPSSFLWQNYFVNWKTTLKNQHQIDFQYIYRLEQGSDSFQFSSPHTRSHTFSINGNNEFSTSQSIKYILKYRNFSSEKINQEIQHNYLGRIDYTSQYWGGFLRWNTGYEIKAGREQKMQQTYVRAPNGYGNYAWRDLDSNGVFELNEAYVSPILTENNYMRFFVVLPEFIPANEVVFSQLIMLQPKIKWYDKTDFRKILSKFSYQLRMDMNKKMRTNSELNVLDYSQPFGGFKDSLLIYSRNTMFQQLSFQKNENKVGFDLEWIYNNAKNLLSNGVEGYANNSYALRSRVELFYFLTYLNRISNGVRKNSSEFFIDRNFTMVENLIENTFSFYIHQNLKINLNANYGFRSTGNQYSISHQGDIEFKVARKNDGIIETRFTLVNLNYEVQRANSQVELAMLNGIPRGLNYIWNLTIGQKLTRFLQLNVIYNGRKNQNSSQIIHSGNVEVRAIF